MKHGIVIVFLTTAAVIASAADRENQSQRRVIAPGQTEGFNPQPEPPAQPRAGVVKPGQAAGFNPQPEPPASVKPAADPATGITKPGPIQSPPVTLQTLRQHLLSRTLGGTGGGFSSVPQGQTTVPAATDLDESPDDVSVSLRPANPGAIAIRPPPLQDTVFLKCTGTSLGSPGAPSVNSPAPPSMHQVKIVNSDAAWGNTGDISIPAGTRVIYMWDSETLYEFVLSHTLLPGATLQRMGVGVAAGSHYPTCVAAATPAD